MSKRPDKPQFTPLQTFIVLILVIAAIAYSVARAHWKLQERAEYEQQERVLQGAVQEYLQSSQ